MKKTILSIDVGSSSIKTSLLTLQGEIIALDKVVLPVLKKQGHVEINPKDLWRTVIKGIHRITAKQDTTKIVGIGITSQMSGLILLDQHGEPLRDGILGIDQRGEEMLSSLKAKIGEEVIYEITGCPLLGIYPAAKLLWLQKHEPTFFVSVRFIMGIKEYIIWRLTGNFVTDMASASTTQLYNQKTFTWWDDMLSILSIDIDSLPEIKKVNDIAGYVTNITSELLKLPNGIPVSVGTGDGPAANLSTGVISEDYLTISFGTTAVTRFFTTERIEKKNQKYFCQQFSANLYLQGYRLDGAGTLIDRYLDSIEHLPSKEGVSFYYCNGSFIEVTDFIESRSCLEAVFDYILFELYNTTIDIFGEVPFKEIRPIGGGSLNTKWMQDLANLFQVPVIITKAADSSLGAGMIVGWATGLYNSLEEASYSMVHEEIRLLPKVDGEKRMKERYCTYQSIQQKR